MILLAVLQFTVVLDLTILAPLGAILMPELKIHPHEFGLLVSAYAFSASASALLAAGYADRFDRKKILIVFYVGFLVGTLLCAIATGYHFLLVARVATGLFGGVIGSICLAIVADLFPIGTRGRVMGVIQSAFAAAQIMGIPVGLFIANHFGWRGPFYMIAGLGVLIGVVIVAGLRPLTAHLAESLSRNPMQHLWRTASNPRYLMGFSATMLVSTGGFMLQPFASAFTVNNIGIPFHKLPVVYMCAGLVGMIGGPLLGRLSDAIGKFKVFAVASVAGTVWVVWFTGLGLSPLWVIIAANSFFAVVIAARMVTIMAIVSAVPDQADRGAYMAVSSSVQQFAGAISAWIAGIVIVEGPGGFIEHYQRLGWVVAVTMVITLVQMYRLDKMVRRPLSSDEGHAAELEMGM